MFIDYPSEIIFDIGFTHKDYIKITIFSKDLDIYLFECDEKLTIIKEYFALTGKPYIPPKWAFGFQQSRWSYFSEEEVRYVANKYRELDIPLDVIYTDIDYMDGYKFLPLIVKPFQTTKEWLKIWLKKELKLFPSLILE